MNEIQGRRLAILTSGGDCSGMNSAICAVIKMALYKGLEAFVIREGFAGLLKGNRNQDILAAEEANLGQNALSYGCGDFFRLGDLGGGDSKFHDQYIIRVGWDDVRGWENQGGTLIGSARCKEFMSQEGRLQGAFNLISNGIDSLVVCGGDGSLTGADIFRNEWPSLVESLLKQDRITNEQATKFQHLHIAGLVASIDNDLTCTDLTIGSSTALLRISESLDSISSTASSHSRAFVIEVMGRHCGWLALMAATACGADYVYVPERPPPEDWRQHLRDSLLAIREKGKRKSIVIIAEGAIDVHLQPIKPSMVAEVLSQDLHLDTRVTTLGHTQRGGRPDANDRILATLQGIDALRTLLEDEPGKPSYIIGIRKGRIKRLLLRESIQSNGLLAKAISDQRFEEALSHRGSDFRAGLDTFTYNAAAVPSMHEPSNTIRMGIMHVGAPAGGMNTATRTAVRFCLRRGHTPLLINNGFVGLLKDLVFQATWLRVDSWASSGGSELGVNRVLPNVDLHGVAKQLQKHNIQGLLIIGGFEAFTSIKILSEARPEFPALRIPLIGLPATLSNNVPMNEYSLGTYTSLDVLAHTCDMIIQSASASRNRVFVVEVQGGQCGFVAVMGALATSASIVYTPEEGVNLQQLNEDIQFLHRRFSQDPEFANDGRLVICNEKASSVYTAQMIAQIYGEEGRDDFDSRYESLSHVLQGGIPSPLDRVQASRLAVRCCEFLEQHAGSSCAWDPPSAMIAVRQAETIITPVAQMVDHADFANRRGTDFWWNQCKEYVEIISGRKFL